jgi:hypothetical protein
MRKLFDFIQGKWRYKKEVAFAEILNQINKKIYPHNNIGQGRVHLYYINKISDTLTTCVRDNNINSDCTELNAMLSNKRIQIPTNIWNSNLSYEDKLTAISNNATDYLRHFNLKLIDFCINNDDISLMRIYNDIYILIQQNQFDNAKEQLKKLYQLQTTDEPTNNQEYN